MYAVISKKLKEVPREWLLTGHQDYLKDVNNHLKMEAVELKQDVKRYFRHDLIRNASAQALVIAKIEQLQNMKLKEVDPKDMQELLNQTVEVSIT